jgi:hypothetical protein
VMGVGEQGRDTTEVMGAIEDLVIRTILTGKPKRRERERERESERRESSALYSQV